MRPAALTLVPLTTISVGTVSTPIMAARDLSPFAEILFAFANLDAANPVDVVVETSEDGSNWDSEQTFTLTVNASTQRSLALTASLRSYFRVSGTATGASVNVKWTLKAEPRVAVARGGRQR